jgi:hypothetical protein
MNCVRSAFSTASLAGRAPRPVTERLEPGGWECGRCHRPRTTSIPRRMSARGFGGRSDTRCVSASRSIVTSWDTLATDSFASPVTRADRRTFPGASAHRRLLVSGTQTAVAIRLRLSASPWTTTTGRRNPGPEPVGTGNSAHQTSPWTIATTRCSPATVRPRPGRRPQASGPSDPRPGSLLP